nr:TetR/AcrR family transcriptional regulator [uncultured Sphaerochaeta sp.]
MPKALSPQERTAIQTRLKTEAAQCLLTLGVKKTTVDELVRRVNIPKGTFYLFYPSKELLFFDVLMEFHDEIQDSLITTLQNTEQPLGIDALTAILFDLFKRIDGSFLAALIQRNDLELLIRKLPPEVIAQHAQTDDISMDRFLSFLPVQLDEAQLSVFSGALRATFLMMLHTQEIGAEVFDEVMRLLLRGIVSQLLEEGKR